jgi:hypothetical protein
VSIQIVAVILLATVLGIGLGLFLRSLDVHNLSGPRLVLLAFLISFVTMTIMTVLLAVVTRGA